MRKVLKALLLTILAYLFQVCAMNQLKIGGVVANLLAVNIAILTVSLGKKYAFGASCVTGILLEVMTSTVGGFYAVIYPAVSMLFAQLFSDMSDEKREIRRNREKNTRDVNPHIRIPLDAMCIHSAYLSYAVGRGAFRAPDCPRAAVCGLYRRAGRSIDAARARIPAHVRRARKTRSG